MFAGQAYSLHTVALMAATTICVLSGAVLLALAGEKLYKRPLFWMTMAMLLFLTAFAVIRFALLIAPTQTIYDVVRKLQTNVGVMSAAAPLMICLALIIRKYSIKLVFGMAVIAFLTVAGTAAVLYSEPVSIADFYPVASFFAFCGFCIWSSKNLFPELTIVSPDAFLKELDDLILVFDRSGRLMKANRNATEVFHPYEGMAREEFDAVFSEVAAVQEDKTISLVTVSGKRYYQYSETIAEKRGGAPLATVLMFSDVTELAVLKSELNDKNERLKAQGEKLEAYIKIAEKLETEDQKETATREIEQAIGQKIEDLTRKMESDMAPQNLPSLIEACRDTMAEVRLVVSRLIETEGGNDRDD